MNEQKFCKQCHQSRDCQKVYQQLGQSKGPSVVVKVIVAFLLPLLVFVGSLAAFERIFAKAIDTKELRTILSLILALSVTFALILIVKAISHSCEEGTRKCRRAPSTPSIKLRTGALRTGDDG